jgi:hypothetical protein
MKKASVGRFWLATLNPAHNLTFTMDTMDKFVNLVLLTFGHPKGIKSHLQNNFKKKVRVFIL